MAQRLTKINNFFNAQIQYDQTFMGILGDMFDHLADGSGTDYSDDDLTYAVKTHPNTTTYVNAVINRIKSLISSNNGDVSSLYYDETLWIQPSLRNAHPVVQELQELKRDHGIGEPSSGRNNGVPGLTIAINGWYGHLIEIDSFTSSNGSYWGTLSFKFYDHFGLDTEDLTDEYAFNLACWNFEGFRQWYIIQHWDDIEAAVQPKPFLTVVSFTVEFSGTY